MFDYYKNTQDKIFIIFLLEQRERNDVRMDKRRSYIYERTYMEYQNRKREDEVESYWKDILGEDIIQDMHPSTHSNNPL